MAKLTFYGGVNEIGGNKILLEDNDHKLFLDFGFSYNRNGMFYEEYLKPRGGTGLLDPFTMGSLPPLEGIYRDDVEPPDLWQQFQSHPLHKKLDHVDGILLSHAHLDHSGRIPFLKGDIPIYCTVTTAFVAKAMQDSGKSGLDQHVCYYQPLSWGCPADWKQEALLSGTEEKKQRQFCFADEDLTALSPDALKFWEREWGFWSKPPKQKEIDSCSPSDHSSCSFELRCFPVDHSIPGACAWGIKTGSGWLIYSGDLRLHGKRRKLTESFVKEAAELHPKALILEGTNVDREANVTEDEVYRNGKESIEKSSGLVFADFSARDVDRLLTFLQIARDTGRKLAILPKDAYLLRTMRLLDSQIPDIAQEKSLVIYQETTSSKFPSRWMRNLFADYDSKTVLAKDVNEKQKEFILCFSFFDLNELPSIRPEPGSLYVYSSSEPHDEEQEIDFRRLHNWLSHFKIKGFGLPIESNGEWQIPEGEEGLHASGHACGPDLLKIVRDIKPEVLIPIHSEQPEFYTEHLRDDSIKVILPELGGTIEV